MADPTLVAPQEKLDPIHLNNTSQTTQTSPQLSRLRQATQPPKPFSAVSLFQEQVLEDIQPINSEINEMETVSPCVQESYLDRVGHVIVPVNMWTTDKSEFSGPSSGISRSGDGVTLKPNMNDVALNRATIDDLSSSSDDLESMISSDEAMSEHRVVETNQLVVLESNIKPSYVDILSLGEVVSVDNSLHLDLDEVPAGPMVRTEIALETCQEFYLNDRALVNEVTEMRAPEEFVSDLVINEEVRESR